AVPDVWTGHVRRRPGPRRLPDGVPVPGRTECASVRRTERCFPGPGRGLLSHESENGEPQMPSIKVGTENNADIELHYNDHGAGKPIVLIHGYPLDGTSWERQEHALLAAGYRCITYDRRGFGRSSQPSMGYDYDTFAADLKALLDHLALDEEVVLAGFSMGTGEVTRYLGTYGSSGIGKAVLIASIPPYLLPTDDNPPGLPADVFEGIQQGIVADRYAFFDGFLGNLYSADASIPERLSEAAVRASFQVAAGSGPYATYACIDSWLTDFRGDLAKIDIPVLAVHGTADRVAPF